MRSIRLASSYCAVLCLKVREASEVRQKEAAKKNKRRITRWKERAVEFDVLIKKLYESFATDKLSEKRFLI